MHLTSRVVVMCVLVGALSPLVAGCEPQLDSKQIQAKIAQEIAAQLKLKDEDVTVSCPGEVSGREGEKITCEAFVSAKAAFAGALTAQDPPPAEAQVTEQVDKRLSAAASQAFAEPAAHPFDRLQRLAPLQRQRAEVAVTVTGRGQITWTLQNISPIK